MSLYVIGRLINRQTFLNVSSFYHKMLSRICIGHGGLGAQAQEEGWSERALIFWLMGPEYVVPPPPTVIQTCFGKSSLNKQNFVNITKLPGLRPLDPYINVNYGIFHPSMDSLARRNIVSLKSQVLDIGFHLHQSGSNMSIFCWTAQSHWPDSFSEKQNCPQSQWVAEGGYWLTLCLSVRLFTLITLRVNCLLHFLQA